MIFKREAERETPLSVLEFNFNRVPILEARIKQLEAELNAANRDNHVLRIENRTLKGQAFQRSRIRKEDTV